MGDANAPASSEAEQEVYEALRELGEGDVASLTRELGKHRTAVWHSLKRLEAKGDVGTREVPTHNRGGRKILFRIAGESAAKPSLPAG